jgi:outer membrane protein OmpA-like peptidoglycan-associated protein
VSDFKDKPNQPLPDDFSETVPNIKIPRDNSPSDWEKTVYNVPIKTPSQPVDDWSKTYIPRNKQDSAQPNFDQTQPNINLPKDENDFGERREDFGATMPFINLPKAEKEKYQKIKPIEDEKDEKKKGIPVWFWVTAILMTFFFVSVFGLAIAYYVFFNKSGFTVVVKGAQPNSEVFVDGTRQGVTKGDGSIELSNLEAKTRTILIKHEGFKDFTTTVEGENGTRKEVIAQQAKSGGDTKANLPNECAVIKRGEFDKAERCANLALDQLPQNYSAEELTKALNIYIINFASGKFNIPPRNMTFLKRAASYIVKLPATTMLEVGGHTDNRGDKNRNQTLSENRAKAVKDALVVLGVKSEMLQTKGYGDTKPAVPNDSEDNRFLNRRIEYTVLSK